MPPIETMKNLQKKKEEIRKVFGRQPSNETKTGKLTILKDVDIWLTSQKESRTILVLLFNILNYPKINKILIKLSKLGNFKVK